MIAALKVSRSTIAAHRRGSVKVLVQPTGGLVGGDGHAGLFLPLGQDLEQQLGAAPVESHVAELVDAQQVDAAVAGDGLVSCRSSAASTSSLASLAARV